MLRLRSDIGPGVKLGWLTEIASPDLARKKKIKKAASLKLQASSLTMVK